MRWILWSVAALIVLLAAGCARDDENQINAQQPSAQEPPTSSVAPMGSGPALSTSHLVGIWWVETIDGYEVEWGRYAASVPWVEFSTATISGNLGCNAFGADVMTDDSRVVLENGFKAEADCSEPNDAENLMWSEQVLARFLDQQDGFEVRVTDQLMRWNGAGHDVTFVTKDRRPEPLQPPPLQRVGRLDCSPGYVLETQVPDEGQGAEAVVTQAERTATIVEQGEPLQWWGVDAGGQVVVGIFLGDAEGAPYQVFTCE